MWCSAHDLLRGCFCWINKDWHAVLHFSCYFFLLLFLILSFSSWGFHILLYLYSSPLNKFFDYKKFGRVFHTCLSHLGNFANNFRSLRSPCCVPFQLLTRYVQYSISLIASSSTVFVMLSFFNFIPPFPLTFNNQYIALINFFFLFIFLFQYLDLFLTRVDGLRRRMASSNEEDLEYKIIRETFQVGYIYFQ